VGSFQKATAATCDGSSTTTSWAAGAGSTTRASDGKLKIQNALAFGMGILVL
jgi:hypothetical protein